jgi:hypothetical protein
MNRLGLCFELGLFLIPSRISRYAIARKLKKQKAPEKNQLKASREKKRERST